MFVLLKKNIRLFRMGGSGVGRSLTNLAKYSISVSQWVGLKLEPACTNKYRKSQQSSDGEQWENPVWVRVWIRVRGGGSGPRHCEWGGRKTLLRTTSKTFLFPLQNRFLLIWIKLTDNSPTKDSYRDSWWGCGGAPSTHICLGPGGSGYIQSPAEGKGGGGRERESGARGVVWAIPCRKNIEERKPRGEKLVENGVIFKI